jgi:cephalosporin hydroxylase
MSNRFRLEIDEQNRSLAVTDPGRGSVQSVDIYSAEGLELLTRLWVKSAWHHRLSYEVTWLGFPVIQMAEDLIMMQELIHKVRPDVLIETGTAHGGSAIFYASLFQLLGHGCVLSVDVEIRTYNRLAILSDPLSRRIQLIEGSSISPETLDAVRSAIRPGASVMVVLDSNHTRDHVREELRLYAPLVTPDSYLVVFDGIMEALADAPCGNATWASDNPSAAVREFLAAHEEFVPDPYYNRLRVTHCPDGFLKRQAPANQRS